MSDPQNYETALQGEQNSFIDNAQAGVAYDREAAIKEMKDDFNRQTPEQHAANDAEMRKNAERYNVDVGDDRFTVTLAGEEAGSRLQSDLANMSEEDRARSLNPEESVKAYKAQTEAGADAGNHPDSAEALAAKEAHKKATQPEKSSGAAEAATAELNKLPTVYEKPTALEQQLSALMTTPGRQQQITMAGDSFVLQNTMDRLAEKGKVTYRNGQPVALVSREEFLKEFNKSNREIHGVDAFHASAIETKRTGGLKDAIGNAFGRKSSLDIVIGGNQETIKRALVDVDKLHQSLSASGVPASAIPQRLQDIDLEKMKQFAPGSKGGAAMSTNVDKSLRETLLEVKETVARHSEQENARRQASRDAKDENKQETPVSSRPNFAYAENARSDHSKSGAVVQTMNAAFSSPETRREYVTLAASRGSNGDFDYGNARSVLQRVSNLQFGDKNGLGALSNVDRAKSITQLALTAQMARDKEISFDVQKNRTDIGSEGVSVGERINALAAVEMATNPEFRKTSAEYLDQLVKDDVISKDEATKVSNAFSHQEAIAHKIADPDQKVDLPAILRESKEATAVAEASNFTAAPSPTSEAGKVIAAREAAEAPAPAASDASASNTAATTEQSGASASAETTQPAAAPVLTAEQLEVGQNIRDAIGAVAAEEKPTDAQVQKALDNVFDDRFIPITDLAPQNAETRAELLAGIEKIVEAAKAGEYGQEKQDFAYQVSDAVDDWKAQHKAQLEAEAAAPAPEPVAATDKGQADAAQSTTATSDRADSEAVKAADTEGSAAEKNGAEPPATTKADGQGDLFNSTQDQPRAPQDESGRVDPVFDVDNPRATATAAASVAATAESATSVEPTPIATATAPQESTAESSQAKGSASSETTAAAKAPESASAKDTAQAPGAAAPGVDHNRGESPASDTATTSTTKTAVEKVQDTNSSSTIEQRSTQETSATAEQPKHMPSAEAAPSSDSGATTTVQDTSAKVASQPQGPEQQANLPKQAETAAALGAEQAASTVTTATQSTPAAVPTQEPKVLDPEQQLRIGRTEAAAGQLERMMEHPPRTFTNNDKTWNESNIQAAVTAASRLDADALKSMDPEKMATIATYASWLQQAGKSGELPGLDNPKNQAELETIASTINKLVDRTELQVPDKALQKVAAAFSMQDSMESLARDKQATSARQAPEGNSASLQPEAAAGGSKRQAAESFAKDTIAMVYGKGELSEAQMKATVRNASMLTPDRLKGLSQDDKAKAVVALKAITDTVRDGGVSSSTLSDPKFLKNLREAENVVGQLVANFAKEPGIKASFDKAHSAFDAKMSGMDADTATKDAGSAKAPGTDVAKQDASASTDTKAAKAAANDNGRER